MNRKDFFHAHAVGNFADGNRRSGFFMMFAGDDHPLKIIDTSIQGQLKQLSSYLGSSIL